MAFTTSALAPGFSFGAKPSAAPGTFSFGTPTPAPSTAPSAPSLFGATPASGAPPPPAFGSTTTAPGTNVFGSPNPAPSTGAGSAFSTPAVPTFGSTQASAAPTSFLGSNPASAPSPGFSFGSNPTPAPSTAFSFGPTPAPSTGFGFASTTAPAPSTGFSFSNVSAASAPVGASSGFGLGQATSAPISIYSSQMPYHNLPPEAKKAFDALHEQMMRHKRTMMQVETMMPALLQTESEGDRAAGSDKERPLPNQLEDITSRVHELQAHVQQCGLEAERLKQSFRTRTEQSILYGVWQLESLSARQRPKWNTTSSTDSGKTVQERLRKELNQQAAQVDRRELIPSPYLWQQLEDMEQRLLVLRDSVASLDHQLNLTWELSDVGITAVVQKQMELLQEVILHVQQINELMEAMRSRYRSWETRENVLDQALIDDLAKQRRLDDQVKIGFLKAGQQKQQQPAPPTGPPAGGLFGTTPAPSGGLFGTKAPTPAPGGFFGSAPTSAPAFGSAPAPGSLFGNNATPAPATSTSFNFGSTPAPAPLFGSTPAAAPGSSSSLFGSSSASTTPKTKSKTRSSRRR